MSEGFNRVRKAGIALVGAVISGAAISAGAEHFDNRYEMTVFGDSFDIQFFTANDLAGAIQRIEDLPNTRPNRFTNANNLCVAHTKLGDFTQAAVHCDEAVKLGKLAARITMNGAGGKRDYATALTNRGVLKALSEQHADAIADFDRAISFKIGADAARKNLVAVQEDRDALVASVD
jgi:hypothetical protein